MVGGVFRLADRRVDDLMTPRPRIAWLDTAAAPAENARRMAASPHSYFPVGRGDLDHVLGIASVKEVWARAARGQPPDPAAGALPPVYVPESVLALQAPEALRGASAWRWSPWTARASTKCWWRRSPPPTGRAEVDTPARGSPRGTWEQESATFWIYHLHGEALIYGYMTRVCFS